MQVERSRLKFAVSFVDLERGSGNVDGGVEDEAFRRFGDARCFGAEAASTNGIIL